MESPGKDGWENSAVMLMSSGVFAVLVYSLIEWRRVLVRR